ncbi:preprotein translocase subunit YajC [Lacticaseibacillus nasuensis]|nr:preprotein translocase subunit YajC [Lacticaseibacillus nasuensis]
MLLMIVVLFAFMYFGMMRPQKKQQQKRQEMLSAMKKGDKIVTIGGLHAVIDSIDEAKQTVDLDCDGVYLTFNLSAIRAVNEPSQVAAPATKVVAKPKAEAQADTKTEDQAAEPEAADSDAKADTDSDTDAK